MAKLSQKFDFINQQGQTLSGRLELPTGKPRAYAIFAHCFTCSKNILAASRISKALTNHDIAVLRFDFTGLGNSEGDFANTNFSSNVADLLAAYQALERDFQAPAILIGHSLGGAAVLKAQSELPAVKAVATIGAPSDTAHVSHLFKDDLTQIKTQGEARVQLAGREFRIKQQFVDDIKEQDLLSSLSQSKKAFLILHSPVDETVSIDHAAKIYLSLKHPKSYLSLDKMDHLVSKPADAEYIALMIGSWLSRYLPEPSDERVESEHEVVIKSRGEAKFTQDIYTKDHYIVADEPKRVGGANLGMNPYELLLSSLGACTAMTMKMYADRKGYNLKDVKVELSHSKEYVEDCLTCEEEGAKLDIITKQISIGGNLSDVEREKIIAIAEKCPVNRTLQSEIRIRREV